MKKMGIEETILNNEKGRIRWNYMKS
jgi:hypothetical protein